MWYSSDPELGAWGGEPRRPVPEAAWLRWAAEQVRCVKMVSASHLWEDSNQHCTASCQILSRDGSMHGWSSDSLLISNLIFIYFYIHKRCPIDLSLCSLIKCTQICLFKGKRQKDDWNGDPCKILLPVLEKENISHPTHWKSAWVQVLSKHTRDSCCRRTTEIWGFLAPALHMTPVAMEDHEVEGGSQTGGPQLIFPFIVNRGNTSHSTQE